MEASSKGAKSCGGHTVGITTKDIDRRPPNPYNDEVVPAGRLIERIDELVSRADGFIVAQGGVGTLCEMFLAWNLNLLGIDKTPIVLLGDYWNNVLSALAENIMITPEEHLIHLKVAETPSEAVDMICDYFD